MAVKRKSGRKSRRSRSRSRSQKRSYTGGNEHNAMEMPSNNDPDAFSHIQPAASGGNSLTPAPINGGGRRRRNKSKRKSSQCGGEGVLATAAVPVGLLALQRYFSGSRKSKNGFRNKSKRTFRRRK